MKFIHAADTHLCQSMLNSKLPPQIAEIHRKQVFSTFKNLIEETRKRKADLLLLCGDIFEEKYAKSSDVKLISELLGSIPQVRVFLSCGNHDPFSTNSLYNVVDFPENVTIFPSEIAKFDIEDLNTAVYGFSWNKTRYEYIPFSFPDLDKNKTNILCLHADLKTRSDYMPININSLNGAGFDYTALGHIHKPEFLKKNIAYPGSLEPLDFSEEGSHGFIAGEINQSELKCEFVPFAKHKFTTIQIDVSSAKSYSALMEKITLALPPDEGTIAKLVLCGTLYENISLERLKEEIEDNYLYLTIDNQTIPDYDLIDIYRQNEDNLIGRFTLSLMRDAQRDGKSRLALYLGLNALLKNGGQQKSDN